jgi:hypothetical protein
MSHSIRPLRGLVRRLAAPLGCAALVATAATGAQAATVLVTSSADAGPGTFRAAVAAASADPTIDTISFDGTLTIELAADVVYTGPQFLTILGSDSTITGDGSKDATWDGGLFVSRSRADIAIEDLSFESSFNNGVGIFAPPSSAGTIMVSLTSVRISGSRFHGLYVDEQITASYNTDDVIHITCLDPWSFQSSATVRLRVAHSTIVGNGAVIHDGPTPDYDASIATGCPVDFDGIRVDEGGNGDILASIVDSEVDGNRADGTELDERGNGGVDAWVADTTFDDNGDTGTDDTDDGFDIDESDNGDIVAHYQRVSVSGNFDEGVDISEMGNGSARVTIADSEMLANEDEGIKVDELLVGNIWLTITGTTVDESLSQQGIEVLESGNGNLDFAIEGSHVEENDNDGIALTEEAQGDLRASIVSTEVMENGDHGVTAEQQAPGNGTLVAVDSDLTENDDTSLDLEGVSETLINTPVD